MGGVKSFQGDAESEYVAESHRKQPYLNCIQQHNIGRAGHELATGPGAQSIAAKGEDEEAR